MRRYLFQVVSFCLLAACVNSGGYVYTPPPPPMPFAVAWDPQEAKSRQFAAESALVQRLNACNSGAYLGKNMADSDFSDLTFVSKSLPGNKKLHAAKLAYISAYTDGSGREQTTAVMLNLTADTKGLISDCLAEKVYYRSR